MVELEEFDLDEIFEQPEVEEDVREKKDALLYGIEVSREMLAHNKRHLSILYRALEAATESVKSRIFETPTNMTGILLYGTDATTTQRYPYCSLLMELGEPTSKDVKKLIEILRDPHVFDEVCKVAQSEDKSVKSPETLGTMLQYARELFASKAPRVTSRRLIIITNNDNPYPEEENQRVYIRTGAEDLVQQQIRIIPTFITTAEHKFDPSLFWESVRFEPQIDNEQELQSALVDEINIKRAVLTRHTLRRIAYSVIIELGPDIKFGAKGFLIQNKQKITKTHHLYVNGERPVLVKRKGYYTNAKSAGDIPESQVRRAYVVGSRHIVYTAEEVSFIKKFEDHPVVRIIGFKPLSAIELWENITHPFFLYPGEDRIKNSRRAFTALYKVLLDQKKVAIAWTVIQTNASPRIAALIPSPESTGQAGLQLVFLPFAEEIRDVPPFADISEPPSQELISLASQANKAIKLPEGYSAAEYPNTRLQSFYNHLEALALGEDTVADEGEIQIPNGEIKKKAGVLNAELARAISKSI